MTAAGARSRAELTAAAGRRWRALDPLLAVPAPGAGCGAQLSAAGPAGALAAAGTCAHWTAGPGSLDRTWGAARRYELAPELRGRPISGPLDQLLTSWRQHLAQVPGAADPDTAAVVCWPSRDVTGYQVLRGHGLDPLAVIAARRSPAAGRRARAGGGPAGLRLRRAGPGDLRVVVRLGMEEIRYDAWFGGVIARRGSAAALARAAAAWLAVPRPWLWLAEQDGTPVGMAYAQPPQAAAWIAPLARGGPVAYLEQLAVLPSARGRGIGTALAARLHRDVEQAGVAVTLLHYSQHNPLSMPFWSGQGYRPLWTVFEARPACSLR